MKEHLIVTCVHNDSNEVVGFVNMTPEGYDRIWEVTDKLESPIIDDNKNSGIYNNAQNFVSKIDQITDESIFDKSSYNPYTQHIELRKLDFVPYSENKIPEVKHYLRKLQNIADYLRNPFVNDAGGSKDFEELYQVITKQLEYFNVMYN